MSIEIPLDRVRELIRMSKSRARPVDTGQFVSEARMRICLMTGEPDWREAERKALEALQA